MYPRKQASDRHSLINRCFRDGRDGQKIRTIFLSQPKLIDFEFRVQSQENKDSHSR